MFDKKTETTYRKFIERLGRIFIRFGFKPNHFTLLGGLFAFAGMVFLCFRSLYLATLFVFLSGLSDSLDGSVARANSSVTKFGALLDSTLDRIGETFIFFGIFYYFRNSHSYASNIFEWLTFFSLAISIVISYIKARAEGLGIECKIGSFQRADRFFVLLVGIFLTPTLNPKAGSVYITDLPMKIAILVIFIGGIKTIIERMRFAKEKMS